MAYQLPYEDNTFDRVVTSLVMHHLSFDHKRQTLGEVFRILRPKGEVHIVDFGRPANPIAQFLSTFLRHFTAHHYEESDPLLNLLQEAGFSEVQKKGSFQTVVGSLSFYCGIKS